MKSLSSKKHEKGQGLVEYALILVLVSIVVIGGLTVLGPSIGNVFSSINNSLTTVGSGGGGGASLVVDTKLAEGAWLKQYCVFHPGQMLYGTQSDPNSGGEPAFGVGQQPGDTSYYQC